MADTLTTVKQCNETKEYLYRKTVVKTSFIGSDSDIETLASVQKKGTPFSGLSSQVQNSVIESSTTEKMESDRTKWNVVYSIYSNQGSGDDTFYTSQDSMTMVQYQFPLYKYLDADESAAVASWENLDSTEVKNKKKFKYKKEDGSFDDLKNVSEKAEKVAKKLFAGIEYVQKSYPQITHVERFNTKKALTARKNKLNHIDDSNNVPDMISDYSWLKTQFDWQENDDSTWTLTESWIGVPNDDPWDPDLYGNNAWTFFIPTDNNNNNNNNNNNQ